MIKTTHTIQLRKAKACLSAVVDAAERGEPTMITRHGRPAAVVMPVEAALEVLSHQRPSLASLLMAIPEAIDFERDPSPFREIDL
jgi:antitoxin Phd